MQVRRSNGKQKHVAIFRQNVNIPLFFLLLIAWQKRDSTQSAYPNTNGHLHFELKSFMTFRFGLAFRFHAHRRINLSQRCAPFNVCASTKFLKCVICFAWWLRSFLMPFRINTLVSICWRCHYYYCHAPTNTSFHNVCAIFMKCILKLFGLCAGKCRIPCSSFAFHILFFPLFFLLDFLFILYYLEHVLSGL